MVVRGLRGRQIIHVAGCPCTARPRAPRPRPRPSPRPAPPLTPRRGPLASQPGWARALAPAPPSPRASPSSARMGCRWPPAWTWGEEGRVPGRIRRPPSGPPRRPAEAPRALLIVLVPAATLPGLAPAPSHLQPLFPSRAPPRSAPSSAGPFSCHFHPSPGLLHCHPPGPLPPVSQLLSSYLLPSHPSTDPWVFSILSSSSLPSPLPLPPCCSCSFIHSLIPPLNSYFLRPLQAHAVVDTEKARSHPALGSFMGWRRADPRGRPKNELGVAGI